MPRFAYRARDAKGRLVRGVEVADHEEALDRRLAQSELCLVEARIERVRRQGRIKGEILVEFCHHLRSVVEGGIPLIDGLQDFCDDESHPLNPVIVDIARKLRNGAQLSEAMAEYPGYFPALMRSLMRAGEETGRLDRVLRDLVIYFEWRNELTHQIKSALAYPSVVIGGIVVLCVLLLTYVLPNFMAMFEELNVELPLLTRMLLALSDFLRYQGVWLLLGIGTTVALFLTALRTPLGRRTFHVLLLKTPLLGRLLTMLEMSRFAHNLAILYTSGIPIVRALDLIQEIVQNLRIREVLAAAQDELRRGGSLTTALQREALVPKLVLRMIAIGEQSGELDQSLERVSAYYDRELPRVIKKTLAIFNTSSVVALGGMIGGMALGIFVPVYKMLGSINAG